MSNLVDLKVTEFLSVLQSDAPAPGGGSVAALSGSLAAALAGMVAGLTIGKKKYEESEEAMKEVAAKMEAARLDFVNLIDVDANSFNDYMAAMKLPKETDEEKAARAAEMEKAIQYAANVPLSVAKKSAELFDVIELVIEKGNQNAITDGAVAAMMARSAVLGAALNVKINLGSIKDEAVSAELRKQTEEVEKLAIKREAEILAKVVL
jgi:methenyltetrahydrofolate cyclohydrolase